jgi:uncharacterized protein
VPDTALITGASSGIGEQFARQLAARGYALILVARREDRLKALADELPVTAHVVTCDLASDADKLAGRVAELGVDVDLLVNNAGFGAFGKIVDGDTDRDAEMIRLNCEAVSTLTHAFLPAMVERDRGGVINVCSSAGFQPIPWEAVYAATKSFALSFTEALYEELRGTNVKALAVNPGPVPTEWQDIAGHDDINVAPGKIEADQVVAESLAAYDRGRRSIVPGRTIRWFLRATAPSPRGIQLRVTERMYRPKD